MKTKFKEGTIRRIQAFGGIYHFFHSDHSDHSEKQPKYREHEGTMYVADATRKRHDSHDRFHLDVSNRLMGIFAYLSIMRRTAFS